MSVPEFDELADRDGVLVRETCHEVDAERFTDVRRSVENGLTWAVGGIVIDEAGRVLLVKEDGQWLAPGGELEDGETHEEALVREIREETGIDVVVEALVAVTDVSFVHSATDEHVAFYFAHYTAAPKTTTLADDPGLPEEDIETVEWKDTVPEETVDRDVVVATRQR